MPLCTTAIVPSQERCGCALHSVTPPCVAHRVWAIAIVERSENDSGFTPPIFPTFLVIAISPSIFRATPHESYPRYSRFLSPRTTILPASTRFPPYPKIPHMGKLYQKTPPPLRLRSRSRRIPSSSLITPRSSDTWEN